MDIITGHSCLVLNNSKMYINNFNLCADIHSEMNNVNVVHLGKQKDLRKII